MLQELANEKLALLTCFISSTNRFGKVYLVEQEMKLNKMIGMTVNTGSSISNQLQTSLPVWAKQLLMAQTVPSSLQESSKAS